MYLFYDFETSSRELLGQILSYAFVLTDESYDPITSLTGKIKLNRTQCPEVKAILTNKINVSYLQETGIPEYEAAETIFNFINQLILKHNQVTLIGFNSNNFDLSFLRNLLVRYGFNPYFNGKLKNLDILHWVQSLAFYNHDHFPWVLSNNNDKCYYSFKLEDITQACSLLTTAQTHDAFEDVILTIKLVSFLEQKFNQKLTDFNPILLPEMSEKPRLIKQRYRDYVEPGINPKKYSYRYFYPLNLQSKSLLFINIKHLNDILEQKKSWDHITKDEKTNCIQYINSNKHFFITESCDNQDIIPFKPILNLIDNDPFFSQLNKQPKTYFQLIQKDWDIEYQIHEIGFDHHIATLGALKQKLLKNQDLYPELLQTLLSTRQSKQDNYLIQLFNRLFLNIAKSPDLALLNRYLKPRYITTEIYRNPEESSSFLAQENELKQELDRCTNDNDLIILEALRDYYQFFKKQLSNA
ncbi:hypothetical protein CL657_02580 [bacterium]|nr:hypothetical protein [bacterium]